MTSHPDDAASWLADAGHNGFAVDQVGRCAVVTADGEIDLQSAPALRDAVLAAADLTAHLVVDLGRVSFLDSSGLSVLVLAQKRTSAQNGSVSLVGPVGVVRKALELTRLDDAFPIFDGVDEAVAAVSEPGQQG